MKKAETSKAETSKAKTSKAETSKAKTSKAETSKAKPSKAETTNAKVKKQAMLKEVRAAVKYILPRAKKANKQWEEIGRYLLEVIFKGKPPKQGERNQPETYKRICKRLGRTVSSATLSYAVRVAYQEKALKKGGIKTDELNFYQQVALLGEADEQKKEKLAKFAIEDESTFKEIKNEIKKAKGSATETKKKADAAQKALNNITKISDSIDKLEKNKVDIDNVLSQMPYQQRIDFARKITELSKKLLALNDGCRVLKQKCIRTARVKGELDAWNKDVTVNGATLH